MKNIRALISHPSCCCCVSAPYRIFSCTLTKFVLNVQSHEPSPSAHESLIDHNLLSRGNFSVKHSSFSLDKLSLTTLITAVFPVQMDLCCGFLGKFGSFFLQFFCYTFLFLEFPWSILNEVIKWELGHFCKTHLPIDRQQKIYRSQKGDSWALSLQKYPKSAVSPSSVQVFLEGTWSRAWAVPPAGTEPPALLGCPQWRAWEHKTVKCSCAREADLFCLSSRLPVLELSLSPADLQSMCPLCYLPHSGSPDPGNVLVLALRRSSAQGHWILVVGFLLPSFNISAFPVRSQGLQRAVFYRCLANK